jgi:hypothetical protein
MPCKLGLLRLSFQKTMSTLRFGKTFALIDALNGLKTGRITGALSAVIVIMLLISACGDGNTLVIGPLSGKDLEGGQAMLDGVNLCVAQINERGGVDGRKLSRILILVCFLNTNSHLFLDRIQ